MAEPANAPPQLPPAQLSGAQPTYALPPSVPLESTFPEPLGALMLARAIPDVRLLPVEALASALRRTLARHGRKLLGYRDPRGHERLRRELATMLSCPYGLATSPDGVMVTRGSQQALFLVAGALLSPGDLVALEALGSPLAWAALRHGKAELTPIPVDDEGLDLDALERLVKQRRLRAVHVTPHHQFPTNAVMPSERRARLAALAVEHRFLIIEDDYDREFQYEGRTLPPVAAGAGGANVIYLGSLSKLLAPGLRVGYVMAPAAVLERIANLRAACDVQGDAIVECAIAELFEDGELLRHVRRMREAYGRRREVLAEALKRHLGDVLTFAVPDGGMAIWARVAPSIDTDAWALAGEKRRVIFRGAALFDFAGRSRPFVRLGFTYHNEAELREAAVRMAEALPTVRKNNPRK